MVEGIKEEKQNTRNLKGGNQDTVKAICSQCKSRDRIAEFGLYQSRLFSEQPTSGLPYWEHMP